jgi:hypothetical protein
MLPTFRLVTLALALAATAGCGDLNGSPAMTPADNGAQPPAPTAACPSLGALKPPTVPAPLAPPQGASLMLRYRAQGVQIYTCKATEGAATAFAWSFKAPEATLLDDNTCAPAGTHFAGPTWKADADQSAVVGTKIAEAPSPTAGSISWLLLKAASTTGQGLMNSVVAVQRVDTAGGVAPADQCSAATVGTELRVPYSATYYFYKN